jgi:hypothetical protein
MTRDYLGGGPVRMGHKSSLAPASVDPTPPIEQRAPLPPAP